MYIETLNENGYYVYRKLNANVHKSVRMDVETYEIISRHHGNSFSEKLRNLVKDYYRFQNEYEKNELTLL